MAYYIPRLAPVPTSELYQTLRNLQSRWPVQASASVQVHEIIGDVAVKRFGPARDTLVSDAETASGKEMAEALERILANTYAKQVRSGDVVFSRVCLSLCAQYPLTDDTLDPLGSPGHYLKVRSGGCYHSRLTLICA
jgi:hypothetical protein